jgi:hypothetical protein
MTCTIYFFWVFICMFWSVFLFLFLLLLLLFFFEFGCSLFEKQRIPNNYYYFFNTLIIFFFKWRPAANVAARGRGLVGECGSP